jgi:hypothetical protein
MTGYALKGNVYVQKDIMGSHVSNQLQNQEHMCRKMREIHLKQQIPNQTSEVGETME